MAERFSLKDLALYCGVSLATVSRVLNGKGGYSKATEAKVMKAVQETGFTLNLAAKALKESHTGTIGLILPSITNPYFSLLASHIENFLYKKGYSLFICNTENNADRERYYFRSLAGKQVDGIIAVSGLNKLTDDLLVGSLPIVCLDRQPDTTYPIPIISNDNVLMARQATDHLLKKGCRNIIYISTYTAAYKKNDRLKGYEQALQDFHIPVRSEYILERPGFGTTRSESETLVSAFLKKRLPVDGVVASSERSALGCLQAIRKAGLSVPDDIRVIGFDNTILSEMSSPQLSSVERNPEELADRTCEELLARISGEKIKVEDITVPTLIVERESTR